MTWTSKCKILYEYRAFNNIIIGSCLKWKVGKKDTSIHMSLRMRTQTIHFLIAKEAAMHNNISNQYK